MTDLARFIRPGDRVFVSEAAGCPTTLVDALIEQRHQLGGVSVFLGYDLSGRFQPNHADALSFESYGALGGASNLARAGCLRLYPSALTNLSHAIFNADLSCDVALVSGVPRDGGYGFGLSSMLMGAATTMARHVLVEHNARTPTVGGAVIPSDRIALVVESNDGLPEVGQAGQPIADQIADRVADFVGDGATLQLGIGAIADAVPAKLRDRRNLGLHSGMFGDSLAALARAGVLNHERQTFRPGVGITSMIVGTKATYDFVHRNPAIEVHPVEVTHGQAGLQDRLVSINGAMEVDLTGNVNAELAGPHYLGAIGGQPDFVRAARASKGGRSIIALASTRKDGGSRIVPGPLSAVSTARSDVDVIVTEYGAAELRGLDVGERTRRLIAIAHPGHRDALSQTVR